MRSLYPVLIKYTFKFVQLKLLYLLIGNCFVLQFICINQLQLISKAISNDNINNAITIN